MNVSFSLQVSPTGSSPLLSHVWVALGATLAREDGPASEEETMIVWHSGDEESTSQYSYPRTLTNRVPSMTTLTRKSSLADAAHAFSWDFVPQTADVRGMYKATGPFSWLAKAPMHGGVRVLREPQPPEIMALQHEGVILQQRIERPLLIDNHAFDIGLYVLVRVSDRSSLQFAIFDDVLLRFCAAPFLTPAEAALQSPEALRRAWVVSHDYRAAWDMPTL